MQGRSIARSCWLGLAALLLLRAWPCAAPCRADEPAKPKYSERPLKQLSKDLHKQMKRGRVDDAMVEHVLAANLERLNRFRVAVGRSRLVRGESSDGEARASLDWLLGTHTVAEFLSGTVDPHRGKDGAKLEGALAYGTYGDARQRIEWDHGPGSNDPFTAVACLLGTFHDLGRLCAGRRDGEEQVGCAFRFNELTRDWGLLITTDRLVVKPTGKDTEPVIAPAGNEVGTAYRGERTDPRPLSGTWYGTPLLVCFPDLDGTQVHPVGMRLFEVKGKKRKEQKLFYSWLPAADPQSRGFWPQQTDDKGKPRRGWYAKNAFAAVPVDHLLADRTFLLEVEYEIQSGETGAREQRSVTFQTR